MPTEEEMKAEIERLRAENENLKKPARGATLAESQRKRRAFGVRNGTLSRDLVSGTVGKTAGACRTRSANLSSRTTRR